MTKRDRTTLIWRLMMLMLLLIPLLQPIMSRPAMKAADRADTEVVANDAITLKASASLDTDNTVNWRLTAKQAATTQPRLFGLKLDPQQVDELKIDNQPVTETTKDGLLMPTAEAKETKHLITFSTRPGDDGLPANQLTIQPQLYELKSLRSSSNGVSSLLAHESYHLTLRGTQLSSEGQPAAIMTALAKRASDRLAPAVTQNAPAPMDAQPDRTTRDQATQRPTINTDNPIKVSQTIIQQKMFSEKMTVWSDYVSSGVHNTAHYAHKTTDGSLIGTGLETQYYTSYQKDPANKHFADAIEYKDKTQTPTGDTIVIKYPNVGQYAIGDTLKPMGALVTIDKIDYVSPPTWLGNTFIDISNNFFSGLTYGGVKRFNLNIQFFAPDDADRLLDLPKSSGNSGTSRLTFGSLNGETNGEDGEAVKTLDGLKAEAGQLVSPRSNDQHDYFGFGEGVWQQGLPYNGPKQFGDFLGAYNYEKGAVSFFIQGNAHRFSLYSASGFTWQSFTSGSIKPLEQQSPTKTVTTSATDPTKNELDVLTEGQADRRVTSDQTHYYWITQPTYDLPDQSIAKPDNIRLEDTLPKGVTPKGTRPVQLFQTDPEDPTALKALTAHDGQYTSKSTENGTELTYTLSHQEISELVFDKDRPFYFRIAVTVESAKDLQETRTMTNQAAVIFDSKTNHDVYHKKETNQVATKIDPTIDLTVNKEWSGDEANQRPKNITVTLYRQVGDGDKEAVQEQVIEASSQWTHTFRGLPKSINGQSVQYTVKENPLAGYTPVYTTDESKNLITITNEYGVPAKTYQLVFNKVDPDNHPLKGASFKLSDDQNSYKLTTNNGKFTSERLNPGTYTLEETKAPDGYQLLKEDIKIVIDADGTVTIKQGDQSLDVTKDESGQPIQLSFNITNEPTPSFPSTGGIGIIPLLVLGILLMLGAWTSYKRLTKRR